MTEKFWMVLGSGTPVYKHKSIKSASLEAERLARENPGMEFVVLESLASVVKSDLSWSTHKDCDYESGNEVPF